MVNPRGASNHQYMKEVLGLNGPKLLHSSVIQPLPLNDILECWRILVFLNVVVSNTCRTQQMCYIWLEIWISNSTQKSVSDGLFTEYVCKGWEKDTWSNFPSSNFLGNVKSRKNIRFKYMAWLWFFGGRSSWQWGEVVICHMLTYTKFSKWR